MRGSKHRGMKSKQKGKDKQCKIKGHMSFLRKWIFKKFQFIWEIIQAKSFQFTSGSSEKKAILIN